MLYLDRITCVSRLFFLKKAAPAALLLFLCTAFIFCDETSDSDGKKETAGITFRGGVNLGFAYFFSSDPVNTTGHYSRISYTYSYDYTDEGDRNNNHHTPGERGTKITPARLSLKTQLSLYYSMIVPCLRLSHSLFSSNGITLTGGFALTPVSIKGSVSASITPIAFLKLSTGMSLGTGWNIPSLGAYGMARLDRDSLEKNEGDAFFGPLLYSWFSLTLLFDAAEVTPRRYKRWTHIVMTMNTGVENTTLLNYPYYDAPYLWELGENRNGWSYWARFIAGYRIPVLQDERKERGDTKTFLGAIQHNSFAVTVLFSLKISTNLSYYSQSKIADQGYGSDFWYTSFGPMVTFDLPNNFFASLFCTWATSIRSTEETQGNVDRNTREYAGWYLSFKQIGCSFGWNF